MVNSSQGGGSKDTWVLPRRRWPRGNSSRRRASVGRNRQVSPPMRDPPSDDPASPRPATATAAATAGGDVLMLARNAEVTLYWIGRYVERADDTARILDVTVHQLLEDASVDPTRRQRTVLGSSRPAPARPVVADRSGGVQPGPAGRPELDRRLDLGGPRKRPRAREVTSSDMWECLNTTYNAPGRAGTARPRLARTSSSCSSKGRAAMFAGLADSTCPATTATGSWCWAARSNAAT